MALPKKLQAFCPTGKTVYAVVSRDSDGYYLQMDGTFAAAVAYPAMTEDAVVKGLYTLSTSSTVWSNGSYIIAAYQQSGGAPSPAADAPPIAGDAFRISADAIVVLDGSVAANSTAIAAIPTDPVRANDARLNNLDAAVSTRSTYAGADTTGTTTLLSRIASAISITAGKVDVNDKTGFSLVAAYDPAKTAAPTAAAIRAEMDTNSVKLAHLDADVSTRSTYAGGPVASVTAPVTVGTNNDKTGYALDPAYDAAKTAASQDSVDAISVATSAEDIASAVWASTEPRATLIDRLDVSPPEVPVVVIPAPTMPGMQVLYGHVKMLGQEWAVGDIITVTPASQTVGSNVISTTPQKVTVGEDGSFYVYADKGARVTVEAAHATGNLTTRYFSKTLVVSNEDSADITSY